jgi:hypothetical protein
MTKRCLSLLLVVVYLSVGCGGNDGATRTERAAVAREAIGGDAGGLVPTSTTLESSLEPSAFGQPVTFTARVAGLIGTPLGVVTFSDGGTELGAAALTLTGRATLSTALLSAGAHSVVAWYPGDLIYHASRSTALSEHVRRGQTTTALSSSSSPSVAGMSVVLTAIVRALPAGDAAPSGAVTFADGNVALGTSSIGPGGVAVLTTSALAVGSHTLSVSYSGDAGFEGSASLGLSQTVNRDGATVVLVSSANPSVFGTAVTFTATVAAATTGSVPVGAVTFRDGFTVLATGTLDPSGTASFETAALSGGSHTISVSYDSSPDHTTSVVASVTQTVMPVPVSVVVTPSVNPSVFGEAVTLTAQVAAMPAGDFAGVVTFFDGAAAIGASTVDASGKATITTSSLSVGRHVISAIYGGDSDHGNATSTALSQTVGPIQTTTVLAASMNPAPVGLTVTFSAMVSTVAPGTGVPRGTVTFRDAGGALGGAPLDANGVATFTVATLTAGPHSVTASYGGGGDFTPSSSDTLSELIAVNSTTIVVDSFPNPSASGASITVLASVSGSVATPTGKITFRSGTDFLGEAPLDARGTAAFTTATLSVGAHTLGAEYPGDAANSPGSGTVTHIVNGPVTAQPTDAGRSDASPEPPHHEGGAVSGAASVAPAPEAASIGGANCGCRFAQRHGERLPGFFAFALGACLALRRSRRANDHVG